MRSKSLSSLVTRTNASSVGIEGIGAIIDGDEEQIETRAVVLACGGFESNREWRSRYLGPGWDMAKVRGTRYNTGDGIRMALDLPASRLSGWTR
jgi:tricarballylate dehydrogenase